MTLQTTKPVKLVHSHAIKKGRTSKKGLDIYSHKRWERRVIEGEVLDKTIHSYRLWFLFLKLALELEEQNAVLVLKEPSRVTVNDLDNTGTYTYRMTKRKTKKVVVNRSKYEGWDLDQVLELTFDKWWSPHRYLFVDQVSKILKPSDTISEDPNHLTIQIDKRRRLVDVLSDLRNMNEEGMFQKQVRPKFSINERVRPTTLQNRYNALVLKIDDELSNREIMEHPSQYIRPTNERTKDGYSPYQYSRTIFDLISGSKTSFGGKQILLSVCDGYFVRHPKKTYL